jgi:3'-phosphoadenosine 5'-phosphosulfate sulfotransferase (PAPS reductase)/FAD synthetase
MKTAPLYKKLKIDGTNKQARVLTFDGVRAEESTRRSGYERIGKGVKHDTVINASPILNWNTTAKGLLPGNGWRL